MLWVVMAFGAVLPVSAASRMIMVSGEGQCAQLSTPFIQPLVVRVVDASDAPVAGVSVTWSDVGGIIYMSPTTVTTDSTGTASLNFVLGGWVQLGSGFNTYKITASSAAGAVTFTAVGYPAGVISSPFMYLTKPEPGEALTVVSGSQTPDFATIAVINSGSNGSVSGAPVPGVGLSVSSEYTDPALGPVASCVGGTVLTGADGTASCTLYVTGKAGSTKLTFSVGSAVDFTRDLTVTAGASTFTIVQGNNQSGMAGTTLGTTLIARLTGNSGGPIAGSAVTWSVVTPGSLTLTNIVSTTDATGQVSARAILGSTPGTYQVKVTSGTSSATFLLTVGNPAVGFSVSTSSLMAGTRNITYSQSLAATGGSTPYYWAIVSGALPAGLSLSAAGAITGTPSATGTSTFTVRATDSTGATATRALSITIGTGLAVATTTLASGSVGVPYSQSLAATGGTPAYSWILSAGGLVASSLPAGLTLSSAGVLSGTPTTAGSFGFGVQVTDQAGAGAYKYITMTVGTGLVITTSSPLAAAATGTAYTQAFAAAGSSFSLTWSITSGTLPPGLTLSTAGVLSGTPTTAGTFSFTVRVADAAGGSASGLFSLTVASGLRITTSSLSTGTAGVSYSQTLAASGGTPPYIWIVASGTLPTGMALSSTGVLSGTPLTSGTYAPGIRVMDSAGLNSTSTFTLIVSGGVAITTPATLSAGVAGTAYSTTLAASGGTTPYSWSLTLGSLPSGLTLTSAGVLSGTPTSAGSSAFMLKVTDAAGLTVNSLFSLEITAVATLARQGVISQLATGGGWKTTLRVYNPGSTAAMANILFYDENGAPMVLPMTVTQGTDAVSTSASSLSRTIQANGGLLVELESSSSTTQVGWADVRGSATLDGFAIFRQKNSDNTEYEGTATLDARTPTALLVPYDNLNGYSTGLAVVNLASTAATVTAILRDDLGVELGRDTLVVAASGHASFSLPVRFTALAGKRGILELRTDQSAGLVALGLRFNPALSFTSVPIAVRP
jgi:hypothetical protein